MYPIPRVIGNRILLEVETDTKKAIKSDLVYIPEQVSREFNNRVLISSQIGKVVQMGEVALESCIIEGEEDELKPGHLVMILQNAGPTFAHKEEGKIYRMVTRGDIMAVVGEDFPDGNTQQVATIEGEE